MICPAQAPTAELTPKWMCQRHAADRISSRLHRQRGRRTCRGETSSHERMSLRCELACHAMARRDMHGGKERDAMQGTDS